MGASDCGEYTYTVLQKTNFPKAIIFCVACRDSGDENAWYTVGISLFVPKKMYVRDDLLGQVRRYVHTHAGAKSRQLWIYGAKSRQLWIYGAKSRQLLIYGAKSRQLLIYGGKSRQLLIYGGKFHVCVCAYTNAYQSM